MKDWLIFLRLMSYALCKNLCSGRVISVWTRIDWTRATHSAWTVKSL